jgi:hypothetical protein
LRTLALLLTLVSCAAVPATAGEILAGKALYSQKNEELVIRDFFRDRRGGFFLDVGCAFPKNGSTTY